MYRGNTSRNDTQSQGSWKAGAQTPATANNFPVAPDTMDYYSTAGDGEVVQDQYTRYDYNQESHGSSQYDNTAQYNNSAQYDNNAQYESNTQYEGNAQYENNAQYDSSQYDSTQYDDSSAQYESGAQYDNTQYDSSAQYGNKQYSSSPQVGTSTQAGSNAQFGTSTQAGSNAQFGTSTQAGSNAQFGTTAQFAAGTQFGTNPQYGSTNTQYGSSGTQYGSSGSQFGNRSQYGASQRGNGSQYASSTQYNDPAQFAQRTAGSSFNKVSQPGNELQPSSTPAFESKHSTWQQGRHSQELQTDKSVKPLLNQRYTSASYAGGTTQEPAYSERMRERSVKLNVTTGSESNMEYDGSKTRGTRTFSRGRGIPQSLSPKNPTIVKKPFTSGGLLNPPAGLLNPPTIGQNHLERNMPKKNTFAEKKVTSNFEPAYPKTSGFQVQNKPTGILKNASKPANYRSQATDIAKKEYSGSEYGAATKTYNVQKNLKMEDQEMENGNSKKPWQRTAEGRVNKKKKTTTLEKSLKLKKYVQPKNAVMCLYELVPSIVFNVEQESRSPGQPTLVTVTVDGQKYRGFGSSKQMAKQAAAEAALISFVKPPPPTGSSETVEDTTPWAILASFAMFKLFNEWREGRVGGSASNNSLGSSTMPPDAVMSQTFQALLGASMGGGATEIENKIPNSNTFSAFLGVKAGENKKEDPKAIPNPAKQVPEKAASIHPVMLLHQMKPDLQYSQTCVKKDDKTIFTVKTVIDTRTFVGEGTNVKKAKLDLAVKANKALYKINTTYKATS